MKIEVEGTVVEVGPEFANLPPAEQDKAVEEIAASLGPKQKHPLMSQLNAGIAEAAGGIVDVLNPFDQPHALNPFPQGTGSAQTGLTNLMGNAGIEVADHVPETPMEGAFRGTGNAIASLPAITTALSQAARAGGALGQWADDAYRSLATLTGTTGEAVAGGIAGAAEQTAESAGAPDWVQNTAAIAAPVAAAGAVVGAAKVPGMTPLGTLTQHGIRNAKAAIAPYTKTGAEEVARTRLQNLAGGPERAEQLAREIGGDNPLNLTPAQQTGDPNMVAVERLAADQNPVLRETLETRRAQSQASAREQFAGSGDPQAAQAFYEARRQAYVDQLQGEADAALGQSAERVRGIRATRDPGENSVIVSRRLRVALDEAKLKERDLWGAVPNGAFVGTSNARTVAAKWQADLGRAGAEDMPRLAERLLLSEGGYAEAENARELHRLYSKLRESARNDRSGSRTHFTRAKVADEIAEAILRDLGAVDGNTEAGRRINEARAFSAALHQTFDQGAPGRLLKLTNNGDQAIDAELALQRTVGRSGTEGALTSAQLEGAGAPSAVIRDYVSGRFADAAMDAGTGAITTKGARRFLAQNQELLKRYPDLRLEMREAVQNRETAEDFAARIERQIAAAYDKRQTITARFIEGSPDDAIKAVFSAPNPIQKARQLARQAREDKTGEVLAGLKTAVSEHLMGQATRVKGGEQVLKPDSLIGAIENPKQKAALRAIFSEAEMSRLNRIAREMAKVEKSMSATPSIGDSLSGAQANKVIEFALRVMAVKHSPGPGGVRDLQTSQMVSSRVRDAWRTLSADRASQMIADAVTDPDLFRALLTQRGRPEIEKRTMPYLLPYLAAGAAVASAG